MRSGSSDELVRLRQRYVHQRQHHRQHQTEQQRGRERLPVAAIVLAAARPRHDEFARRQLAELPLDDPVELAKLFLFLRLEQVVLDQAGLEFVVTNLIDQRPAPVFDSADVLLEGSRTTARAADLVLAGSFAAIAPEEAGSAGLAQLLERAAGIREQSMLLALPRQGRELRFGRAKVVHEAVELRAHLGKLRQERLAVLVCFGFHGAT